MQSRKDAQHIFWSKFSAITPQTEFIPVKESCDRVTAAPVFARLSSPSFHSAAMDGIAVKAEDTFAAADDNPITLDIAGGQATLINTGHPLPPRSNAVIMVENILLNQEESEAVIREPVFPWQYVRKVGEDIVATELLFPTGHLIQPADIAAMITAGCTTVEVRSRPIITIIPTGSELVPLDSVDTPPPAGQDH